MKFDERRDEFAFFLGFAARNTGKYLNEAIKHQIQQRYGYLTPNDAFSVCPFNDTLEQLLRNYHISVNENKEFLQVHLANLEGAPIKDKHLKRMIKRDFVALWGPDTDVHWAYHAKLTNIPFI